VAFSIDNGAIRCDQAGPHTVAHRPRVEQYTIIVHVCECLRCHNCSRKSAFPEVRADHGGECRLREKVAERWIDHLHDGHDLLLGLLQRSDNRVRRKHRKLKLLSRLEVTGEFNGIVDGLDRHQLARPQISPNNKSDFRTLWRLGYILATSNG
jgi:hypothetical protein